MHYAKQTYYSRIRRDSVCNTFQDPIITSVIDAKKITAWGESGFPARFLVLAFILWGIVIAAVVGALRHLMKRPHLTSEQKLVALLVSSVITVPVSGLLYFPIAFLAAVLLPFGNFSVGEEALSAAVFLGPLVLIIGLGFFIAGNVEDRREARRQARAKDAID